MGLELIYFKNYKNVFLPSKCTFIYFTLVLALCALHSGMLLPTLGQIQFYSWLFAIWNSKILKHSWHYWKPCLHDHVLSWEKKKIYLVHIWVYKKETRYHSNSDRQYGQSILGYSLCPYPFFYPGFFSFWYIDYVKLFTQVFFFFQSK